MLPAKVEPTMIISSDVLPLKIGEWCEQGHLTWFMLHEHEEFSFERNCGTRSVGK